MDTKHASNSFFGLALGRVALFMLCVSALVSTLASPGLAQDAFELPGGLQGLLPQGGGSPSENLMVTSRFQTTSEGGYGLLHVTASLGDGWNIYSVTQKPGGPKRTQIVLEPSAHFEVLGAFKPDSKPESHRLEFYNVPVEEHVGQVTWTAPIRLADGTSPEGLEIRGKLDGQICEEGGGCVPLMTLDTSFAARVEGILKELPAEIEDHIAAKRQDASRGQPRRTPAVDGTLMAAAPAPSPIPAGTSFATPSADGFQQPGIHAALTGYLAPSGVKPGATVNLVLTARMPAGWHIYAYAKKNPKAISQPTLIAIAEPAGWVAGEAKASSPPTVKKTGLDFEPEQRYHDSEVTWTVPVKVPADARGRVTIRGAIGYQTCTDSSCDRPVGAFFETTVTVGNAADSKAPLKFAKGSYSIADRLTSAPPSPNQNASATPAPPGMPSRGNDAGPTAQAGTGPLAFDLQKIEVDESVNDRSLITVMLLALAGGFLLNFMPCVLPVIGLKIMSFVQQAGENRSRVLLLNVAYALGMLAVFWLLALLASGPAQLGWGEQFNNNAFTITLLCVVFVMGLSFIGVWEIPIPGFVGSSAANDLAQKEGISGAFFKGVLTTVLATPCSGPGVAAAITWSAGKPAPIVFTVFTCMGLGMALPYLLIGAFPSLIRFIPRPGAWMDTFKQAMGFVLMGTVVYLFTLVKQEYVVPTLALIFALWAACWWIGRIPVTASLAGKLKGWVLAGAFSAVVGWLAFGYEPNRDHELPWEEFSLAALDEHVNADRTVLVDFTANWCPTCKVLERTVLNTRPVRQMVDKNEVVTLVADWTDADPEIAQLLDALGSKQLPVIAIFPADDPYRPKKLSGGYTRSTLIQRLQAAGPSRAPRVAVSDTESRQ